MKKLFILALSVLLTTGVSYAGSKDAKEIAKERKEIMRLSKAELNEKVSKVARKEAKRLKKKGWDVKPAELPMEKQLERSYLMQYEYDENLFPKYIMGEASSVGENYAAAKTAATSLASTILAGQIQTEVTALIENTVANRQLSAEDATSISETVMASKNLISQSIDRTIPVMVCYRINSKKKQRSSRSFGIQCRDGKRICS
jgi:hypothetical protein